MDPNETLRLLREMAKEENASRFDAEAFCALFEALDEWLSRGGLLPTDWAKTDKGGWR